MKKAEIAAIQHAVNVAHQDYTRAKIALTEAMIKGDHRAEALYRDEARTSWDIRYGALMVLNAIGQDWELDELSRELEREMDEVDERFKTFLGIK